VEEGNAAIELCLHGSGTGDGKRDVAQLLRDAVIVVLLCGKRGNGCEKERELDETGHGRPPRSASGVLAEPGGFASFVFLSYCACVIALLGETPACGLGGHECLGEEEDQIARARDGEVNHVATPGARWLPESCVGYAPS